MRLPCVGKSVDLSMLCEAIKEFFAGQAFTVACKEMPRGYQLLARPLSPKDKRISIVVQVEGHPDNFTIDFSPLLPKTSSWGSLLSRFMGGWTLRERYHQEEQVIAFERSFWSHVVGCINTLKGSSTK